jgi:hypothetical protein
MELEHVDSVTPMTAFDPKTGAFATYEPAVFEHVM